MCHLAVAVSEGNYEDVKKYKSLKTYQGSHWGGCSEGEYYVHHHHNYQPQDNDVNKNLITFQQFISLQIPYLLPSVAY